MEFDDGIFERAVAVNDTRLESVELHQRDPLELSQDEQEGTISGNGEIRSKSKVKMINNLNQWRSQKFGLGGAVGQFWLKSLINIEILDIKG